MDYAVVWQHVILSPWWCVCCAEFHSAQHTAHTHTTYTSNYVARAAIPSFENGKEPLGSVKCKEYLD
jgi:hypothetical protein